MNRFNAPYTIITLALCFVALMALSIVVRRAQSLENDADVIYVHRNVEVWRIPSEVWGVPHWITSTPDATGTATPTPVPTPTIESGYPALDHASARHTSSSPRLGLHTFNGNPNLEATATVTPEPTETLYPTETPTPSSTMTPIATPAEILMPGAVWSGIYLSADSGEQFEGFAPAYAQKYIEELRFLTTHTPGEFVVVQFEIRKLDGTLVRVLSPEIDLITTPLYVWLPVDLPDDVAQRTLLPDEYLLVHVLRGSGHADIVIEAVVSEPTNYLPIVQKPVD